jgi:hypothetical protein
MNLKLIATYSGPLTDLTNLIIGNKAASKVESDARDARKGGLVDTLRLIAVQTNNDGVPTADASDMLRFALNMPQDGDGKQILPSGTVKNYCAALRGYHKMLEQGRDISEVSTAEATAEVASAEQKRITAAKKEFAGYSKKWNADQWEALAAAYKPAAVTADATDEETADVETEAKVAA